MRDRKIEEEMGRWGDEGQGDELNTNSGREVIRYIKQRFF